MKKFLVLIVFLLLLTIAEDSSVSFSTSYLPNSYSTDPGGGDEMCIRDSLLTSLHYKINTLFSYLFPLFYASFASKMEIRL